MFFLSVLYFFLRGILLYGLDNWNAIAKHVGNHKTPRHCMKRYYCVHFAIDAYGCPDIYDNGTSILAVYADPSSHTFCSTSALLSTTSQLSWKFHHTSQFPRQQPSSSDSSLHSSSVPLNPFKLQTPYITPPLPPSEQIWWTFSEYQTVTPQHEHTAVHSAPLRRSLRSPVNTNTENPYSLIYSNARSQRA